MTDTEYTLIQCPNGHDLQAARDDLSKKLACPVCEIHFVPAEQNASGPHATPPQQVPTNLEYGSLPPLDYPGTTEPLRYLWLFVYISIFGLNLYALLSDNTMVTPGQTPAPLYALVGCSFSIAFLAACIVQLMWIYRIHADAQKFGMYDKVSPLIAVLLSIIPLVNLIWTAVAMRMLATFADQRNGNTSDAAQYARSAKGITSVLIVISVVWMSVTALFTYQSFDLRDQAIANVRAESDMTTDSPEFQRAVMKEAQNLTPKWKVALGALIPLIAGISYFLGTRRLVDSLYPALGVPRRE